MTRDKLRELMARASQAVGMEFGEVPTSVEHATLPEAKMDAALNALSAAGYAVVPLEANDNSKIVDAGRDEYRHKLPYRTLYNVMVDAGNILKGDG